MHKPRPSRGRTDDPSNHIGFLDSVSEDDGSRKAARKAKKDATGDLDLDRLWE